MKRLSLAMALGLLLWATTSGVDAQAQAPKRKPVPRTTCNALTDEGACKARDECTWVSAVMDAETQKVKRRAYCRTKPKLKSEKK